MKKALLSGMLALSLGTASVLVGCSNSEETSADAASNGVVELTLWHAMGGGAGKGLDAIVQAFNDSHDKIKVNAVFQGSYDDEFNKYKTAQGSDTAPALMQVYDIGTRYMIDSEAAVPVQKFIDAEKYDTSDFEKNILNYYTLDGKLYSMPFNSSNPILYYNKDAFKEAGLDPNQPPKTWAEVNEDAKKLTKKTGGGQTERYGMSMAIYGWFFEQYMANQLQLYANNGNGRQGRATQAVFNNDAGVAFVDWWKQGVDSGTFGNFGRKTADTQAAFAAGKTAMFIDSTAAVRGVVDGAQGKFEVGTAELPKTDGAPGGVIIGGGSMWIMKDQPEAKQKAAWEFIKFMADPKTQAVWHTATGYFPIRTKAYDVQELKDFDAKYPQFQTAVNQLHNTKPSEATSGAVIGVFPEARATVETTIEDVLLGKKTTKDSLDGAAQKVTDALGKYNQLYAK
ncbi:ABC transporter substrate-binding protein [Tumebacillus flagellatus]|uniref:ABC transporter substrate-binding protein n=1 Tax=Tumebacillus flagellatus TaxID=1157490 RepID=A0A074LM66_9BACL|nr:ABC transporter substrate-binding protein [Tumebacillus flagellatus]KEO82199.1 ABC transporter substrate-binding protein [Tumebacillus flagellatus]